MIPALYLLALILGSPFVLAGCCSNDAPPDNSPEAYSATFLFEKDGIRIYRFSDRGYSRYFTSKGDVMSGHRVGKSAWKDDSVSGAK